jgi:hypothetical protein
MREQANTPNGSRPSNGAKLVALIERSLKRQLNDSELAELAQKVRQQLDYNERRRKG